MLRSKLLALVMLGALWTGTDAAAIPDPCEPPFPVIVLTAESLPDGSVMLDWSRAPGAIAYEVFTDAGSDIVIAPETAYIDTLAVACQPNSYSVRAIFGICPSIDSNTTTVTPVVIGNTHTVGDFDGDAATDRSVYRLSNETWHWQPSSGGGDEVRYWGTVGDLPVTGDFDGDGIADPAIFRPSTQTWWIQASCVGQIAYPWGLATDVPVPADYDGDGKTDFAIFRPSSGDWWIVNSQNGQTSTTNWGLGTDVPVPADYDGDGKADVAIWRPSNGEWRVLQSSAGQSVVQFGALGDVPVPADYDGDGLVDRAVFRRADGDWWMLQSSAGLVVTHWGVATDQVAPGDYDADGKADLAVFRDGTWYVLFAAGNNTTATFGTTGDLAVPWLALQPAP